MKMTIILIFALCTLMGCGSAHQTQLVHQVERDTIYHQNIRYDSIYIYHDHYMDRSKDTVYYKEKEIEYRYQLLRDTIRIVQRDSIPYEVIVTEIKEVKYIPWWCKTLAWIGGICLALLIRKVK
jgi:hypothetical protein